MPSTVVALLAERPEDELREMQARLESERARVTVELEQVTEALTRRTRRTATKPGQRSGKRPGRPGTTQKRILAAVARFEHPVSPSEIMAEMEVHGPTPSRGSIHNTIARLVKNGLLTRPGEGQYQLASRNGASSDADTGPTENETGEPLFPATRSQEGL